MKKSNRQSKSRSLDVPGKTKVERGPRITLLVQTPEHLRTLLDGVEAYEQRFETKVAEGVRDFWPDLKYRQSSWPD